MSDRILLPDICPRLSAATTAHRIADEALQARTQELEDAHEHLMVLLCDDQQTMEAIGEAEQQVNFNDAKEAKAAAQATEAAALQAISYRARCT